jgi:hypothetical protein
VSHPEPVWTLWRKEKSLAPVGIRSPAMDISILNYLSVLSHSSSSLWFDALKPLMNEVSKNGASFKYTFRS